MPVTSVAARKGLAEPPVRGSIESAQQFLDDVLAVLRANQYEIPLGVRFQHPPKQGVVRRMELRQPLRA